MCAQRRQVVEKLHRHRIVRVLCQSLVDQWLRSLQVALVEEQRGQRQRLGERSVGVTCVEQH